MRTQTGFDEHSIAFALATGMVTFEDDRDCEKTLRRRRFERRKGSHR